MSYRSCINVFVLTYSYLGNFLYINYEQANSIIKEYTPEVAAFKLQFQLTDADIEGWIDTEWRFLEDLKDKPPERILACAYVEALIF